MVNFSDLTEKIYDVLEEIDSDYYYLTAGVGAYGATQLVRPELLFVIAPALAIVFKRVRVIKCRISHRDLTGKSCPRVVHRTVHIRPHNEGEQNG